jgi:hypothetical protein
MDKVACKSAWRNYDAVAPVAQGAPLDDEVQQPVAAAAGPTAAAEPAVAGALRAGQRQQQQQAMPSSSTEACSTAAGLEVLVQEGGGTPPADTACQLDQRRCLRHCRSSTPARDEAKVAGGMGQQGEGRAPQSAASLGSGASSSSAALMERDC